MQPSVVVCSDLTVCASHCLSQNCPWLGYPCAFPGECSGGGEAGDNSGKRRDLCLFLYVVKELFLLWTFPRQPHG